ncbi:MAG: TusE/DsrC/DsvC family sulfur relay protein, partial [Pseudomonadota bacterium]|nr:TusE/DsrC/DsvC family sulfur relay protein [Pseudomonadota bacterium]
MASLNDLTLDKDGFLVELNDWNADVAAVLAQDEGIILTDAHWEIINAIRAFYAEF